MLRIRKITDALTPSNRAAVEETQAIIRAQFPQIDPAEIAKLPDQMENPFRYGFVCLLFVAEGAQDRIRAIALMFYDPRLRFSFLDFISTSPRSRPGTGLGSALYERVREEAASLGSTGLYFECLPDDPTPGMDPADRKQNAARLRFYERHAAFPITGTAYQLPLSADDTNMPFLMFDGLGRHSLPDAAQLRRIVRAILERKYSAICPPEYVDQVVASIRDGGYALRPPRYVKADTPLAEPLPGLRGRVPLVVNDRHEIHHVRERGYVEAPVRVSAILAELEKSGLFRRIQARRFPDRFIREVHDTGLLDYIERTCREAPDRKSTYPYVFPVRNPNRRPRERSVLAGYWCIDTFTPLNRNAWPAARQAVDCALTAADRVVDGAAVAYALVRPPGHHAERRAFGGFCYLCNCAVVANYMSRYGRVAILDIDYHHGNGQQDIFYERGDVLTVSIHGHPSVAYPYFTGFRDEVGRGPGAGYNINIPLPETITPAQYREALQTALRRIARFEPTFLVVALGFDTARGDPTGTWSNQAADFLTMGRMIGDAGYPTAVIQEGGYRVRTLGVNARNFFTGLVEGADKARRDGRAARPRIRRPGTVSREIVWREAAKPEDAERIRRVVAAAGIFTTDEIGIAVDLVNERIEKGRASSYEFALADSAGTLVGYACYGPVPGTEGSFDLYWIVVHPDFQGRGLGRRLLARVEEAMVRRGGGRLYVETSTTARYAPVRGFYEHMGFVKVADLADFYRAGDGKAVFVKTQDKGEAQTGQPTAIAAN